MNQIEVRIVGSNIVIKAPFEQNLVDDIKVIPKTQRRWADPEWIIMLHDPNQKPDEKTNLQYILDVCKENATRLNWHFADYTNLSTEEIKFEKEAIESDRQNAIKLAIAQLNQYDRSQILAQYGNRITFKPSWAKKKILQVLCTQEFSEELLDIPKK